MADQGALEGTSMVVIIEAFAAFALVAGILVALADTRLYPLALGIVVIGGLAFLLRDPSSVSGLGKLVNRAGSIASGQSKPNP